MKPIVKLFTFGAICAAYVFAQNTPPTPAMMAQRQVTHLAKTLTLNSSQQTQATTLFTNAATTNQSVMANLRQARTSLTAAIKSNDTASITSLTTQIGTMEGQMAATNATAEAAFYALLTPAQQAQYTPGAGVGFGGRPGGAWHGHGPQQ